jgi:bifunctional non-homologous end joining protein LigD
VDGNRRAAFLTARAVALCVEAALLPSGVRRKQLPSCCAKQSRVFRLSEHIAEDGPLIFAHACRLGLDGIVSKRIDAPYRSGRVKSWIKTKNRNAAAYMRVEDGTF